MCAHHDSCRLAKCCTGTTYRSNIFTQKPTMRTLTSCRFSNVTGAGGVLCSHGAGNYQLESGNSKAKLKECQLLLKTEFFSSVVDRNRSEALPGTSIGFQLPPSPSGMTDETQRTQRRRNSLPLEQAESSPGDTPRYINSNATTEIRDCKVNARQAW